MGKINTLLAPVVSCVDTQDTDDVRLSLLSWRVWWRLPCAALRSLFCARWSMQQKLGRERSGAGKESGAVDKGRAFARGLRGLVQTNRKRLEAKRAAMMHGDGEGEEQPGCARAAQPAHTAAASVAPQQHLQQHPHAQPPPAFCPTGGASAEPRSGGFPSSAGAPEASGREQVTLQLYPVDEATHSAVAAAGHNPFLELTFRARKPVASLLVHLSDKWATVPARLSLPATAHLRLFPPQQPAPVLQAGWGPEAGLRGVRECLGGQAGGQRFSVKYGWVTPSAAHDARSPQQPRQQQQYQQQPLTACAPACTPLPRPGGLLSMLLEPTPESAQEKAASRRAQRATFHTTPLTPAAAMQEDLRALQAAMPPCDESLTALCHAWGAPQRPHGQQSTGGGCALLPDLLEFGAEEEEFLRDLSNTRARTQPLHQPPPQPQQAAAAPHVRGCSLLGPPGDATGDMFAGIGSLLGAEPSWLPAGAGPAAVDAAAAPSSFAGLFNMLQRDQG